MKEVFKMSPFLVNIQDSNLDTMSADSIDNLINDDLTTSITPILEETANVEKSYSSKVIEVLGKNFSYLIATGGNITAQMIVSTTVAKTPWSKKNVIHSLLFSGWFIALDTLSEPYIFGKLAKIKNWMRDKLKNNENDINFKKELMKVTTVLLALSYSGVLLDKASNHHLDNWFSVKIFEQTSIEFLSYILNSILYGAIISVLEKWVKLSWGKFKNLFSHDNNIDVEVQPLASDQNINVGTKENSNFFCQDFLTLCLITPVSMFITWATEDFISNQEFTLNKMLTDAPKVTGGIILSLTSSLINYMVNKEGIPFLPRMSTIKKWCGYEKNDILEEEVTRSLVTTSNQDISEIPSSLVIESSPCHSISDPIDIATKTCSVNLDSCSTSSEEFQTAIELLGNEEQYNFEKSKLFFTDDDINEIYYDTFEEQETKTAIKFNTQLVNNYGTFKNGANDTNSSDSGISSSDFEINSQQLFHQKQSLFQI